MTEDLMLSPSEQRTVDLLSAIESCEQYGYDKTITHFLLGSDMVSTEQASLFGLESFEEPVIDRSLLLQAAMEQAAGAEGTHAARMERVTDEIHDELDAIQHRLDDPEVQNKPNHYVGAIAAVLGALVGARSVLKLNNLPKGQITSDHYKVMAKELFGERRKLKDALARAKQVKDEQGNALLKSRIAGLKAQLNTIDQSIDGYRQSSNRFVGMWKTAGMGKKTAVAAVAILVQAAVFWILSQIILSGLRWVKSKLGSPDA